VWENMEKDKKITFAFGRFNPPTIGHKKLIDTVKSHAKEHGTDHLIIASHTQDSKKNPLSPEEKEHHLKKQFPNTHIAMGSKEHANIIDHLDHLHKQGYTHATLVAGSDRVKSYNDLIHKYNGTHKGARYNFKHLEVKDAGQRDPDAEGTEGASGSKQREHAKAGNFKEFASNVPVKKHAKDLYHAVRKGMKLENIMPNFKALFLVGGPGSGKDFLIHSVLDECKLKEVSLDKLFTAIVEQTNINELNDFPSVIVNGNADNKDKIVVAKVILEAMGYDTAMVYVHTTDEESKTRNDSRILRGSKTFNESVREKKYEQSVSNMHEYAEMFESFVIYDNSNNFSTVNEEMQQEIASWLVELSDTITGFLSQFPKNEASLRWIAERVLEVGTKETANFAKAITPGQGSKNAKTYSEADRMVPTKSNRNPNKTPADGDKWNGGTPSANKNAAYINTVEAVKKDDKEKVEIKNIKDKKTKQSLPPSVDGRVASYGVPSMGVASVAGGDVGGSLLQNGNSKGNKILNIGKKQKGKFRKYPTTRGGLANMNSATIGGNISMQGLTGPYSTESIIREYKNILRTKQ